MKRICEQTYLDTDAEVAPPQVLIPGLNNDIVLMHIVFTSTVSTQFLVLAKLSVLWRRTIRDRVAPLLERLPRFIQYVMDSMHYKHFTNLRHLVLCGAGLYASADLIQTALWYPDLSTFRWLHIRDLHMLESMTIDSNVYKLITTAIKEIKEHTNITINICRLSPFKFDNGF